MQPSVLQHTDDIKADDIPVVSHMTTDDTAGLMTTTPSSSLPLNLSMGVINNSVEESPMVQFTYHQEDGSVVLTPTLNFHEPEGSFSSSFVASIF